MRAHGAAGTAAESQEFIGKTPGPAARATEGGHRPWELGKESPRESRIGRVWRTKVEANLALPLGVLEGGPESVNTAF